MDCKVKKYSLGNQLTDRVVQNGGIPWTTGYLEHVAVIWEHIQGAQAKKSELHVMWLDLAKEITTILKQYFFGFSQRFFFTLTIMTAWIAPADYSIEMYI